MLLLIIICKHCIKSTQEQQSWCRDWLIFRKGSGHWKVWSFLFIPLCQDSQLAREYLCHHKTSSNKSPAQPRNTTEVICWGEPTDLPHTPPPGRTGHTGRAGGRGSRPGYSRGTPARPCRDTRTPSRGGSTCPRAPAACGAAAGCSRAPWGWGPPPWGRPAAGPGSAGWPSLRPHCPPPVTILTPSPQIITGQQGSWAGPWLIIIHERSCGGVLCLSSGLRRTNISFCKH